MKWLTGFSSDHGPDTDINGLFTGLELTVSGLRHENNYSAAEHLRALIQDLHTQGHPLPQLNIVAPSPNNKTFDFISVSLAGELQDLAHPDLLEQVRVRLDGLPNITARWKIASSNTDKTRQLSFIADYHCPVLQLKTRLENIFCSQNYHIQTSFIPNNSDRLTFLFFNHDHVRQLLDQPPVIDGHVYYPITPQYIEPIFGLEIAINGIVDIHGAKTQIDRYLKQQYGRTPHDPIVRKSRLALNGAVYCAILPPPSLPVSYKIHGPCLNYRVSTFPSLFTSTRSIPLAFLTFHPLDDPSELMNQKAVASFPTSVFTL